MTEQRPNRVDIRTAATTLFQIEKGYLIKSDLEVVKTKASQTLRKAGPHRVREILKPKGLEHLNSGFWASDTDREKALEKLQ